MKRKWTIFIVLLVLLLTASLVLGENEVPLKLWIKGNYVQCDVDPFIEEGRTLVPLRIVSETLKIPVQWKHVERQVVLEKEDELIIFTIDEEYYSQGDEVFSLDVAPQIVEDRTFVPIRVIAEIFGEYVDWDHDNRTVVVGEGYVKPEANTFQEAVLTRVVDGDTLEVSIDGETHKLRLILVDAPESKHPIAELNSTYGDMATEFVQHQLPIGTVLYLQKDVSETDQYNRLLRYVWTERPASDEPTADEINQWMFNAILLQHGYAKIASYPPDVKYVDHFRNLSETARLSQVGLWAYGDMSAPVQQQPQLQQQGNRGNSGGWQDPKDPAYLYAEGRIIGNVNSMIYHSPGQQGYKKVAFKNAIFFDTATEAQAAGFRAAKR